MTVPKTGAKPKVKRGATQVKPKAKRAVLLTMASMSVDDLERLLVFVRHIATLIRFDPDTPTRDLPALGAHAMYTCNALIEAARRMVIKMEP